MPLQSFIRHMQASPAGLMLVNGQFVIEAANQTAAHIFGYEPSELEGQSLHILIPPEHRQAHTVHESKFKGSPTHRRMGENLLVRTFSGLCKDGRLCELEIGLNPADLGGKQVFVISVSDRTELIEAHRRLQQNNLILQKQNRDIQALHEAQRHFLSVLSHELKTPSHSALQQIRLLEECLSATQPELLDPLHDLEVATREVVRCIRSVMDYADVTNHKFSVNLEPIGLLDLINQRLNTLKRQYRDYKGELVCQCSFTGSPILLVDQVRLRRIIFGLASNAILHGQPTKIEIQVNLDTHCVQSLLQVTVTDNGKGIPSRILPIVTHRPMVNVNERQSKGGGGLGMSLYLFKNYLDEMGGRLTIESEEGQGTRASFELPVRILGVKPIGAKGHSEIESESKQPQKPMSGMRILIVEDEPMVAKVTARLLTNRGAETVIANNGAQALEVLKWPSDNRFDVVLMDLDMPVMNGYDACREIRKMDMFKELPIYAVTASKEGEAFPRALESGMNACFSKPFDPDSLQLLMADSPFIENALSTF